MNPTTIQHRPPSQIERELFQAKNTDLPPVPNIGALQAAVNHATTMATLDPLKRPELHEAVQALQQGHDAIAARGRHNTHLANLQRELDESVAARRIEAARRADDRLQQSVNEYKHACLVAARALRGVLNVQHQSAQVPGAASNISALRLEEFHVGHMWPMSWGGSLGAGMMQGRQSWEDQPQPEREAA